MNSRQVAALEILLVVVGIIFVPGLFVNNLQSNGLVSGSQQMVCDQTLGTCVLGSPSQIYGEVCSVNASFCNLKGSSIQVLNVCSPWTQIIQLDYTGFVQTLFGNCPTSGQPSSQTSPVSGSFTSNYSSTQTFTFTLCIENVAGLSNPDISDGLILCQNVNPSIVTPTGTLTVSPSVPLYISLVNKTSLITAPCIQSSWNGIIGNATVGSTPTYTTACMVSFFTSGDFSTGSLFMFGHCLTYGNYYGTPSDVRNRVTSLSCDRLTGVGGTTYTPSRISSTSSQSAPSVISFILGLIGGTILIILGLGISGGLGGQIIATGGQAWFNINAQGTKMMQTFGIGLLLWGFAYSEGSVWFTSHYLPYGLDGGTGLVSLVLTFFFFFSLYILSQSGSPGGGGGGGN